MNLSSQKSAIALSASAAALLMPVSAFAEDGAAGADILIPKMAEFIPALIAFLIIWIVLAKVALPGIMKTMEERGKKIEESLDEAEKTKQEAIAKRAESDSVVTDARRQAADIVLEARKDAESERARIIEAAHKEAEEIIAKAHTTVEDERKSIYAGAASSIADLSVAVATKIVGEALEDDAEQKKLIERYRPELIIFGKSMVLHKEPVAEIRKFVDEQNIHTTIMYDMAHVLGLIGDHFQNPFAEGAEIVTGSTHKTFFGPQRGVIGVNYKEEDLKYGLWKTIESRTFPGSVSNHHLGTQLGMLMAAYEMNQFRDTYQKAVIDNAKSFARSLRSYGLDVVGDPAIDYTETHQVIVSVGYGEGPEIAERLERNNIVVNYQATPDEEGFTASGALRMGVSEMTRFGFEAKDFDKLAGLMADCILRGTDVKEEVQKLRGEHLEMRYCFDDAEIDQVLEELAAKLV